MGLYTIKAVNASNTNTAFIILTFDDPTPKTEIMVYNFLN